MLSAAWRTGPAAGKRRYAAQQMCVDAGSTHRSLPSCTGRGHHQCWPTAVAVCKAERSKDPAISNCYEALTTHLLPHWKGVSSKHLGKCLPVTVDGSHGI